MDTKSVNDISINGGKTLHGSITTNGSKNASVGLLAASLLNKGTTTLHNISLIEDVYRLLEIMKELGVEIEFLGEKSIKITRPERLAFENLKQETVSKAGRSSLLFLPGLILDHKEFEWAHAGGCKMGERSIGAHRYGLEKFGVHIETRENSYRITKAKELNAADIMMYEASDTGAENLLMMASLVEEETVIRFAPPNYMVQDVAHFLLQCGVEIKDLGTPAIRVQGSGVIRKDIEFRVSEDPIESMMFISAALTTHSSLTILRCPIDFLRLELLKLELMGAEFTFEKEYVSENGYTNLVDLTLYGSTLHALSDKIHPLPYPGINSDNLPFFVPIATQAEGQTMIHDWMWENRAIYFTELNRLGANIILADPHRVFVTGPTELKGARIVCPPALRPSTTIMIAMMAAKGESILHSVYSINRGYENIFERLNSIGAEITPLR